MIRNALAYIKKDVSVVPSSISVAIGYPQIESKRDPFTHLKIDDINWANDEQKKWSDDDKNVILNGSEQVEEYYKETLRPEDRKLYELNDKIKNAEEFVSYFFNPKIEIDETLTDDDEKKKAYEKAYKEAKDKFIAKRINVGILNKIAGYNPDGSAPTATAQAASDKFDT